MSYNKVVLIDDDEEDQEIFLAALKRVTDKVECIPFGSAQTALTQLEKKQVNPDLIFLDLNMPIMNGQQFLKKVKAHDQLKEIPVIILSTSSNADTIRQTKELGADKFITKSIRFSELVDTLQTILGLV